MSDPQDVRSWCTENGVVLSAIQRLDGAWSIRLPHDHEELWCTLLDTPSADISGPMLVMRPADQGHSADSELQPAGFAPVRQQTVWRHPVVAALSKPPVTIGHRLVQVTSLDAEAVARLDNEIRGDIPGTEGWHSTGAELMESLDDPEFDSELYLVAQHLETGSLDGLIRVWNREPEPWLGCIGVTRPWRRTRLALSLFQDIARTLHARKVTHIVTETDTTNHDSHVMARRQGGEAMRTTIEWQRW